MNTRSFPLLLVLLAFVPAAKAEEITVIPSIGFGFSDLKFKRSIGDPDNSRFNTLEFSLTGTYKRFYIRANTEVPLGTEFTSYASSNVVREFKREDYGLALGYYLTDKLSVFGGYSSGKTTVVAFKGAPQFALYTEHRDKGPFVGANYSFYIGDKGTLAFNLAYASMDGELIVEDTAPLGPDTALSGDTEGYSVSTTWSDSFKGKANYYITYKIKEYETDLSAVKIDKSFNIITFGFLFPL